MKRIKLVGCLVALVALVACSNLSNNVWRTEQTAVNVVYSSYIGYTNWSNVHPVPPTDAEAIKRARLSFAGSISVVEAWRQAYMTNASVEPQLQAALDAALAQSSNVVWLITVIKGQ